MLELLLTLTTISLLDSLSAVPIALVPLAIILNGRTPITGSISFISGGFIVYFIFGLLILLGLDSLIDQYAERFIAYMKSEPDCVELVIQAIVGFIMIYFAWQSSRKAPKESEKNHMIAISHQLKLLSFQPRSTSSVCGAHCLISRPWHRY